MPLIADQAYQIFSEFCGEKRTSVVFVKAIISNSTPKGPGNEIESEYMSEMRNSFEQKYRVCLFDKQGPSFSTFVMIAVGRKTAK